MHSLNAEPGLSIVWHYYTIFDHLKLKVINCSHEKKGLKGIFENVLVELLIPKYLDRYVNTWIQIQHEKNKCESGTLDLH
jgi:hypothetical protein